MNLARLCVERPVGATAILAALLILGFLSLQNVGLDLLPRMEVPLGTVVAVYPGADPQMVEEALTKPIEGALATVAGLERLRSYSMENAAVILVEFSWRANLERAFDAAQSALDRIEATLPSQAYRPLLVRIDPSQLPLMSVAVSGEGDLVELTRRIETVVVPALQQVPGVGSVSVAGGLREEVAVNYDSEALADLGLTPALLHQILAYQNMVVPAGVVEADGSRFLVRTGRRIDSVEALKEQPVAVRPPSATAGVGFLALAQFLPVRLADVASVERRPEPQASLTLVNGEPSVLLTIVKQSGENTVAVSSRVRARLAALASDQALALDFHPVLDQADLIRNSLVNVAQAGAWGAALAVAVLLLFLRHLGALGVIAAAIPLSGIAAVAILQATGTTLNLMSLGGLAAAAGMVVDNAIVVIENITRQRSLGRPPKEAAIVGTGEITAALVASTLTTLVVFLPIATLQSLIGQLFRDLAIAVGAAIFASLLVAITVVPAAASLWMGGRARGVFSRRRAPSGRGPYPAPVDLAAARREAAATREGASPGGSGARPEVDPPETGIAAVYRRLLEGWLARRWATPVALLVVASLLVVLPSRMGSIFLPEMDGGLVRAYITFPPGMTTADAHALVRQYDAAIRALPEVAQVTVVLRDSNDVESLLNISAAARGRAEILTVLHPRAERRRSAAEIAEAIAALPRLAGEILTVEADRTATALGEDYYPGLTLHVTGTDLDRLAELAAEVEKRLAATPGFRNVTSSLEAAQPELFYRVTDRSFQGVFAGGEPLTAGQVGLALRNHITGTVATHLLVDGLRLPVVLRPDEKERESVEALNNLRIPGVLLQAGGSAGNPTSRPILERIATVEQVEGPRSIQHVDRARLVVVRAQMDGLPLFSAEKAAAAALNGIETPPGYEIRVAGIHRVIDQSLGEMLRVLALAVAFVYIVMAVVFESWTQPLLLMLSVPLAAVGALGALYLLGLPLSVPAMIGLVLLIGIAVNNGIVMIDRINQLRRDGASPHEAVVAGSVSRLRPILITVTTTLFGIIPLALARGEGSEIQIPLSIAVGGGLLVSTLLTLFLLPGLLLYFAGRPGRRSQPGRPPLADGPAPGPALLLAAALTLGLAVSTSVAAEAASAPVARWGSEFTLTVIAGESEPPRLFLGAGLLRRNPFAEAALRVGAAADGTGPVVAGVRGLRYFAFDWGTFDLSLQSDVWLGEAPGHETRIGAGWQDRLLSGRAWVTRVDPGGTGHAGDHFHPWSARSALEWSGWQAGFHLESPFTDGVRWERGITLQLEEGTAPAWVLVGGPTFLSPIARAFVHGGLILHEGTYAPVARLGSALSVLPAGEVEITIAPVRDVAPRGWPVFGAGYRGTIGRSSLVARIEWGTPASGFGMRGYLNFVPAGSPVAVVASVERHGDIRGALGLRFNF